jgi:putative addiction module component (TIGR02574 family)
MNARVKAIADEAQKLSPEDRAELVELLLLGVREDLQGEMAPDLSAEWVEEIEARIAALDRGEVRLIPAEEVFAKYMK